jgi:hypothetical protein
VLAFVDSGKITHVSNRFPIQAFGLALVLIAAAGLRRVVNPLAAAGLLVMLVSERTTAFVLRLSAADGMVVLGLLCALDCFLRDEDAPDAAWARLGGIALGFLAWSKHEGTLLAALVAVAVLVVARAGAVAWLAPPAIVLAFTWAFNAWFGFRNDLVQGESGDPTLWSQLLLPFGHRGAAVAGWIWRDWLGSPSASRLLAFPLVLLLAHPAVRARRRIFAAALMLVAAIAADFWIFAATPREFAWHWSTAGARVLSQTNAAIALVVGAMAGAAFRTASFRFRSTGGTPPRR